MAWPNAYTHQPQGYIMDSLLCHLMVTSRQLLLNWEEGESLNHMHPKSW